MTKNRIEPDDSVAMITIRGTGTEREENEDKKNPREALSNEFWGNVGVEPQPHANQADKLNSKSLDTLCIVKFLQEPQISTLERENQGTNLLLSLSSNVTSDLSPVTTVS
eukprot:TRINITY_DN308_c0_g1_i1.p1 TRINITY_DN308_c0_g1~~TRINITY_DN308_c0_g1_i1.p1  ORF type:complete len:110 (+),score=11.38 TRINITY_DN308_c0_g1_i1:205-534(+)